MAKKVLHVVLFKTGPLTEAKEITRVRKLYEGMLGVVEGLEWVNWGINVGATHYAEGWTTGCLLQFEDRESRDGFLYHPLRRRLLDATGRWFCEDRVEFEMEVEPGLGGA